MKTFLRWLNRKGVTADAFVIVILVVGLAVAIGVTVYFITRGKVPAENLFKLTKPLEKSSGMIK